MKMFGFIKKKRGENDSCRYCVFARAEDDGYMCKYSGKVKGSSVCWRYKFDPFAHRTPRLRSIDTTMFDPLDFKID